MLGKGLCKFLTVELNLNIKHITTASICGIVFLHDCFAADKLSGRENSKWQSQENCKLNKNKEYHFYFTAIQYVKKIVHVRAKLRLHSFNNF